MATATATPATRAATPAAAAGKRRFDTSIVHHFSSFFHLSLLSSLFCFFSKELAAHRNDSPPVLLSVSKKASISQPRRLRIDWSIGRLQQIHRFAMRSEQWHSKLPRCRSHPTAMRSEPCVASDRALRLTEFAPAGAKKV
jgi:hypothetical protein